MKVRARVYFAAVIVLAGVAAGCGLKGMREMPADRAAVKPPTDRAAVVFMRSAPTAATTSLFELSSSEQPRFIGLLVQNTRMVYLTAPGRTRFMVIGRSASFLDAELAPGKTYEVAVVLGDGVEEHFRLVPASRVPSTESRAVEDCRATCKWVENTDRSEAWARGQASSIQRKKAEYLPKWERRPNRPTLAAGDGR
jgi:predicted small lipoprotein YifL